MDAESARGRRLLTPRASTAQGTTGRQIGQPKTARMDLAMDPVHVCRNCCSLAVFKKMLETCDTGASPR